MKRSDFLKSLATVFAAPSLLAIAPKLQMPKELPKPKDARGDGYELRCGDIVKLPNGNAYYCISVMSGSSPMATLRSLSNTVTPNQLTISAKGSGKDYMVFHSAFAEK